MQANTKSNAASPARLRLFALRGIPEVLERCGVQSRAVLKELDLTPEAFEDPQRSVAFDVLDRLFGACVQRTRCAHFGLLVGQYVGPESFGISGRLLRNAPSVGAALQNLTANSVLLHDSGGVVNLVVRDGSATVAYSIHAPGLRNVDQMYDVAAMAGLNILRKLCGDDWRPSAVLLPRSRPRDIRPYREAMQAPLRFNSMRSGLLFPARCLERPVEGADPLLHKLLEGRASVDRSQIDPLLRSEVRRVVHAALLSGECSRAEVARRLGLHPRTLVRRLHESGATYQALLDETRSQAARQLLHNTRSPVSRIAASLGYRDPTVFTRAFRRWTGLTPREFRAALPDYW